MHQDVFTAIADVGSKGYNLEGNGKESSKICRRFFTWRWTTFKKSIGLWCGRATPRHLLQVAGSQQQQRNRAGLEPVRWSAGAMLLRRRDAWEI